MSSLGRLIIAKAESLPGIKAGIARLNDVLNAPSHQISRDEGASGGVSEQGAVTEWPAEARSVVVLGLHHPEEDPRLDWWDERGSPGDRHLVDVCESLAGWLRAERGLSALPLPYHPGRGGLFLKDAAALAGLGVVGRNNLLVNPEWGPRIRLRAVLLEGDLDPTGPLEAFWPCTSCAQFCHLACPRGAFSTGSYDQPTCADQMVADESDKAFEGALEANGNTRLVIKYCRACELACPVGL